MTTRIILGLLMLTGFAGLVSLDTQIGPPFPLLHVLFFGACLLGALEIRSLLPPEQRSHPFMILWCLGVVILAPLGIHLVSLNATGGSWIPLSCSLALALWSGFLGEMAFYRERTNALPRIAFLQMSVLYIGLPCALALQIPERRRQYWLGCDIASRRLYIRPDRCELDGVWMHCKHHVGVHSACT